MTAGETVYEDGAAVGTRGRSGQSLKVGGEIFGIVGEGVEIFASDDDGAGVIRGFETDGWGAIGGDGDLLGFADNEEAKVEDDRSCTDGDGDRFGESQIGRDGGDGVSAGG